MGSRSSCFRPTPDSLELPEPLGFGGKILQPPEAASKGAPAPDVTGAIVAARPRRRSFLVWMRSRWID